MKIGLWLQDHPNDTKVRFNEVMNIVKDSDIDLLVFPEDAYVPFNDLLEKDDCVFNGPGKWSMEADNLAIEIGKPIIFSARQTLCTEKSDKPLDIFFSYYTNPFATKEETISRIYFKNTKTGISPLEFENYEETFINELNQFLPIVLRGKKIGMTICYDCTFPIFSALYGVQNVDILINMTGGNIDYHKWYRYNQVRAMENECFSLVTMGYQEDKTINSYVYGFDSNGSHMSFTNLMDSSVDSLNLVDSVYVYDTENYSEIQGIEQSAPSENKQQDLIVEAGNVAAFIAKSKRLNDYLYILHHGDDNIVFAICDDELIQVPEIVSGILYNEELKSIKDKKYILVNRRKELSQDFLNNQLDSLLRVRAMENYCAVILESPIANRCYQTTKTRKSQVVKEVEGKFGIDLKRTTGPDSIWDASKGKAIVNRRITYETLIDICSEWSMQNFENIPE